MGVGYLRHVRLGPEGRGSVAARLRALAAGFLALLMLLAALPALAAYKTTVEIKTEPNFGRMIITFPDQNVLPAYKVNSDNGVLVLTFDQPVELKVDRAAAILQRYVMIARTDPEGLGARFALARGVKVNTMEAGPQLFIDFLPGEWTGPAPRLPDEVIAELARRADEAAKAAKAAEMMKVEGSKTARVQVSASRTPTFSRITFKWNVPFEANFNRGDAGVSLTFNRTASPDLGEVKAALPPFIDDISFEQSAKGTTFTIGVQAIADVRAFKDDNDYVVDVEGPADPSALAPIDRALKAAIGENDATPGAREVVHASGDGTDAHAAPGHGGDAHGAATPALAHGAPDTPAADHGAAVADGHGDAHGGGPAVVADHAAPESHTAAPADHAALEAPVQMHETTVAPDASRPSVTVPHGPGTDPAGSHIAGAELPDDVLNHVLADGVIRVEARRVGQASHIVFPYPSETGSALITRGTTLWLVFDNPSPIDLASLQDALIGYARNIEPTSVDGAQVIRIELTQAFLSTIGPDGNNWMVTIGEMISDPTRPLPISRNVHVDGRKSLEVPFGPASRILTIKDTWSGEDIVVVTGKGQPRGLVKPQEFTEVRALASANGLGFIPKVDDLKVTSSGEMVVLSRPGGLAVSTVTQQRQATLYDLPGSIGSAFNKKNAFVDFKNVAVTTPGDFWELHHKLTLDVSQAHDMKERVDRWYKIATFNLANGLGPETIGSLNLISRIAPEESTTDKMQVLRAGGELLTYRPADTVKLLDEPQFRDSNDASVWRAMALSDLGKHADAAKEFARGNAAIPNFPPLIQRRYMLSNVATAIELGDFSSARDLLSHIDPNTLSGDEMARLDLLNALARDAAGRVTDAIDLLSNIIRERTGEIAAEATYRLVQMQRREGLITLDQAIDRLEQLAVAWRGDELELKTLRLLGQFSIERGNFRRAFEVLKTAEQIKSDSNTLRLMTSEMQAAFASLFLDGKASSMEPVQALALYYDFRELTPNGRRGDAMVRKLADRLVDVDLLPQAAELLNYQVQNRLRGAARAQVAADLALIYLLDHHPDRSLLTLAKTRQAELPVAIERQRRTVEAKALSEAGNPDLAIELIKPLEGLEIERLKADILWNANRYRDAGAQFERLLGSRWNDQLPLSDVEQMQVLKAGISYTLDRDRLSIDRLRSKYAAKMAATANGPAFEAVTGPIVANGADFDQVVKSVASADTMAAFLADYRKRYLDIGESNKPQVTTGGEPSADAGPATGAAPPPAG